MIYISSWSMAKLFLALCCWTVCIQSCHARWWAYPAARKQRAFPMFDTSERLSPRSIVVVRRNDHSDVDHDISTRHTDSDGYMHIGKRLHVPTAWIALKRAVPYSYRVPKRNPVNDGIMHIGKRAPTGIIHIGKRSANRLLLKYLRARRNGQSDGIMHIGKRSLAILLTKYENAPTTAQYVFKKWANMGEKEEDGYMHIG